MDSVICRQCGACCRQSIVEITHLDVLREPRLLFYAKPLKGYDGKVPDDPRERDYMLSCAGQCSFLEENNRCAIYPTRPNVCVAFEAGDDKCRDFREGNPDA